MKNNIWIILLALIFTISCKNSNSENTTENSTATAETAVDNKQEENNSKDNSESPPTRQQETVNDKVADLLKEQTFFKDMKDAKSGTEKGIKVIVSSSYEYIEKDGKKVLDGKACINMVTMGYGSRTCASFKEGVQEGVAYKAVSVPSTTMLKLDYKAGAIEKAAIFTMDMEDCQGLELPNVKTLAEAKAELENTLQGKNTAKLRTIDCPKEMNELFDN